jgi:hypothetical protein
MGTEDPPRHGVHFYAAPKAWLEPVLRFIESGLEGGEAVVVTATSDHWDEMAARLRSSGWDPEALRREGRLCVKDAERAVAEVVPGSMPDERGYRALAEACVSKAMQTAPRVRWWGEIVHLLVQDGRRRAAVRIEELLQDITRHTPVSVLCSYGLDPLASDAYEGLIQDLCRTHTSVESLDDRTHRRAVNRAIAAELGPPDLNLVRAMFGARRLADMPASQGVLLAVRETAPRAFDRILARVRKEARDHE